MADGAAERLWEVDVARTVAIAMMVVYHVAYDVHLLAPQLPVDPFEGWWRALQVMCGSTFLGVVGISFWVSHARGGTHVRRAVEVLAAAALVSIATFAAMGSDDAVRFGILHLIGVLMLVVLPIVVRLGYANALLGAAVITVGLAIDWTSDTPGLLVLGAIPPEKGVDWYPLLPWAGCALIGLALGRLLYPDGRRGPLLQHLPTADDLKLKLGTPGRHSLPIYLIHQPILIALTAGVLFATGTEIETD